MTEALQRHETVHIIARDDRHQGHIAYLLNHFGLGLQNIDLGIIPTDDVWVRDNGPRYPMFAQAREVLREATTESGRSLTLAPLPIPRNGVHQVTDRIKWRVATLTDGLYTNYYTANGVVLVPVYGNANDQRAQAIIGEQFPGREVIGIDVVSLIEDGGAIGCVTQPQPARRFNRG